VEVNKLPSLITNAHVISSAGLVGSDAAHFTPASYREFGKRYAKKMIEVLGLTTCTPTAIIPFVQTNGGSWQQTAAASVTPGSSVMFGPQPVTGGSWSWSGPNNFSATTREVFIGNIQSAQAGNYVATYTNANGCRSTQTFTVTVTGTSIVVRARGTQGTETIELRVNNTTIATWTLTTAFQNYTATGNGTVSVHFTNDNGGRDVQVDYVTIGGATYQAENQATNTGVWMNNTCGGSNSEWINCNGFINFATSSARMATGDMSIAEEQSMNADAISLYPNPASKGRFTILLPGITENAVVRIYDNQGRMLYEKTAKSNNRIQVDARLKAGLYHVSINSKGAGFTKKLIVK
jgi:hypothetical protein